MRRREQWNSDQYPILLPKAHVYCTTSRDEFFDALMPVANKERFFLMRTGRNKFYWRLKRMAMTHVYLARFGKLPEGGYLLRNLPLNPRKATWCEELRCRKFLKINKFRFI